MEVPFHEMEDLTIESENNLETLWHHNDVLTSNSFSKLQNICIGKSHKLTYLFPPRMVRSLVFLNTLKVSNCELLERIFEIDRDQVTATDDARVIPLTKLSLDRLPNLEYIWTNDPGELLTFPNLKEVDVARCPRLKSVFPASFVKRIEGIESLSTKGENEIFAEDIEASKVVFPEMVLFPSLRSLGIHRKVVKKRNFWVRSAESFPKLQRLCLFGSEDEGNMVTLPLEMSEVLYKIEELKIEKAFELVQVFQNKHYDYVQSGAKLKRLDLYDLRKLTHVWEVETEADKNKHDDEMIMTTSVDAFDSLERIEVRECESLKCILPSSITFFSLTYLEVSYCDEMTNLVSSTVAKNLVSLETMKILGCEGMTSVVMIADGEEEIIFKKMKCLKLFDLPRLASFGSSENGRKCTLKFPELETLSIKRCPEVKTFSYGRRIDTPKLTFLITEEGDIPVSEAYGLNDIIQILLTNDQDKEDSEEDDEEDEEEEF